MCSGSPFALSFDYELKPVLRVMGAVECDECRPGEQTYESPCWEAPVAELDITRGGEPIEEVRAIALTGVTPTSGGAAIGLYVVRTATALEWGTYDTFTGVLFHGGPVTSAPGIPAPSLGRYEEMVALSETNVPGEALLAYRDTSGSVFTQEAHVLNSTVVRLGSPLRK